MRKKFSLILIVVLALTLAACERSFSQAPQAAATPPLDLPKPASTEMNIIETALTQTAVATTGGLPIPTASGNATAVPAGATAQPAAATTDPNAVSTALPSPTPQVVVPAANTPVPQPVVQTGKPATYTLHQGEFPYCLARRFNVNPDELLALNGLSSAQSYYPPGTVIKIPQTGNPWPGTRSLKTHPAQYTVQSGDTIYSVACEFGDVDPMSIVAANNLTGSYNLTTGTTIQIP
jgi:LysM repeat protein